MPVSDKDTAVMRSGEEQTSSMIFIAGFIVLVAIFVSSAFLLMDRVDTPESTKQVAEGGSDQVATHLAELADRCWRQGDEGLSAEVIDCFTVTVIADAEVAEQDVVSEISIDPEQFSMPEPLPAGETEVKVRYENGEVMVTRFGTTDGGSQEPGDNLDTVSAEFTDTIDTARTDIDATITDAADQTGADLTGVQTGIHATLDAVENLVENAINGAKGEAILADVDGTPTGQASQQPCPAIDQAENNTMDALNDARNQTRTAFNNARSQVQNSSAPSNVKQNITATLNKQESQVLNQLNQVENQLKNHFNQLRNQHNC